MAEPHELQGAPELRGPIDQPCAYLKLALIAAQYAPCATQAAATAWSHVDDLARLLEGAEDVRRDRATQSRLRLARFPILTTLDQFRWDWPTRLNRLQVPKHFRLTFIQDKATSSSSVAWAWGKPAWRRPWALPRAFRAPRSSWPVPLM